MQVGWHLDPASPRMCRYWDGEGWVDPENAPWPSNFPRVGVLGAGPLTAVRLGLEQYARFGGRSTRSEYWWWGAFVNALALGTFALGWAVHALGVAWAEDAGLIAAIALVAATLVPTLAVTFRRLHDSGRSGWWWLISFVPWVGPIILLVMTLAPSDNENNRYGVHPL